jgi:hypothetical protein
MSEFKVGQKVRIVRNPTNVPGVKIGDIYTIKEIDETWGDSFIYGLDVPEAKNSRACKGLYWFTKASLQEAPPERSLTLNQILQALIDGKTLEVKFPGRGWNPLNVTDNFSIFHTSAKYRIAPEKVVEKFHFVMQYPGQVALFVTPQKYANKEEAESSINHGAKVVCQVPNENL